MLIHNQNNMLVSNVFTESRFAKQDRMLAEQFQTGMVHSWSMSKLSARVFAAAMCVLCVSISLWSNKRDEMIVTARRLASIYALFGRVLPSARKAVCDEGSGNTDTGT